MKQLHDAIQPLNNNVIYVYSHPDYPAHEGFLKIGKETGFDSKRHIVGAENVTRKLEWQVLAQDINGNIFDDKDIHAVLERKGYQREQKRTESGRPSEWFKVSLDEVKRIVHSRINCEADFATLKHKPTDFALRPNQQDAVNRTVTWYEDSSNRDRKFLWNAKPRFGKTVTAYEFAQRIGARRILVVTQRTAISESWFKDYYDWIKDKTDYVFGSAKNNVNKTPSGDTIGRAFTTHETVQAIDAGKDVIYYISLTDIKGKNETKAEFKQKNQWLFDTHWDLFIFDEAHEGKTEKFKSVFDSLDTDFALHLSGTPFRALANNDFGANIYNWTYADEQEQKESWDVNNGENPYADMPTMNIFAYQMSDELKAIASTDDFSFDFGEFFKVSGDKFVHEDEIVSFLDKLASQEDRGSDDNSVQYYPFADRDTRDVLRHTFWLLPSKGGIKIANTLKVLLQNHSVFGGSNYEIISAVSSGDIDRQNETALKEVTRRITNQPWKTKTITLSCGQLTTGVTVRPWTGVLMLNNLKSPSLYLQAAFRAQNPWQYEADGETFNKTDCYVFDFAPDRILKIVKEYAVKLDTSSNATERKVSKLLNFLSVISQDETGKMRELDARDVMTLPLKFDVADVVNNGFMDNKLFAIGNIFNLPKDKREEANEYLSQLKAIKNKKQSRDETTIHTQDVEFDENGQPIISQETIINTTNGLLKEKKYAIEGSEEAVAVQEAINRGEEPTTEIATREEVEQTAHDQLAQEAKQKKQGEQQEQRDHLRGFSRTIPMFLMAYGKPDTTLAHFDKFVNAVTFEELAGISIDAFRFLRDECRLFNEEVFNASIREFLKRKAELARYYQADSGEDIFEYIPPQSKDNNQIFTPKKVVIQMLDTLETADPSLFRRDNTRFLDPHMKSGLFIAEIVKRLYKHSKVVDEHERIRHILTKQVYGFASTKILLDICRQTIASFDYKLWDNFKLKDEKQLETDMQGAIIEEWGSDMKFDVIIGNPPYQQSDGGGTGTSAIPLYNKFIMQAISLRPRYLSMIVPSRWFAGGKGLDDFRDKMLHDRRIKTVVDYFDSTECFPGVDISGGVNYFLWDSNHSGDTEVVSVRQGVSNQLVRPLLEEGADSFIRFNGAVSIVRKINSFGEQKMTDIVSNRKPFGDIATNQIRSTREGSYITKVYAYKNNGYMMSTDLKTGNDWLSAYKVFIAKAYGERGSFPYLVTARPFVGEPGSACTETYLLVGPVSSSKEAENLKTYIATRLFRFLVLLKKNTQNAARNVYSYVPVQDFTQEWTDEKLYKKYSLIDEEIAFIESMIRPMDLK